MGLCEHNLGAIALSCEVRVFAEMCIQYLRELLRFSYLAGVALLWVLPIFALTLRGAIQPRLREGGIS